MVDKVTPHSKCENMCSIVSYNQCEQSQEATQESNFILKGLPARDWFKRRSLTQIDLTHML